MKAILTTGGIVEIDTKNLFNNQYNTTNGNRIMDADITSIQDDARQGMGRCKYCGALVKRGEEEKHFQMQESKDCEKCFWFQRVYKGEKSIENDTVTTLDNGIKKTVTIKTTTTLYNHECTYNARGCYKSDCTNKECRAFGIDWFTPENTFFLAFPNGFDYNLTFADLKERGFQVSDTIQLHNYFPYVKKIGSYTLEAITTGSSIKYFRLWNCNKRILFRIVNNVCYLLDLSFGWRKGTLEVPEKVKKIVWSVCHEVQNV